MKELAHRLYQRGAIRNPDHIFDAHYPELIKLAEGLPDAPTGEVLESKETRSPFIFLK